MLRDLTLTSISTKYSDDVIQAVQDIRNHIANMIIYRLADELGAVERRLLDLLPPGMASNVHAHIQIPNDLHYEDGNVQILQIRTFSIQDVELGRSMASIRWEDDKLIPEVKTEWYLDETQLRNFRLQGDFVFQA